MADKWNVRRLKQVGAQGWRPQTGIEWSQGNPYPLERGLADQLSVPTDPGVNLAGWINPYSLTQYQIALNTNQAAQVAPGNLRRAYLIMQNQGPGNAFVAFGATAIAPTALANASCLQLIQTQFYEQVGGGSMDIITGYPVPGLFVSPDYITAITDQASTTILVLEGVFQLSRWAQYLQGGAAVY
jgi:hypothetical protein